MAEVTVNFNTKEKTLVVEMNGKKMKDVSEISFFSFGDSAGVEIRSVKREDEDGIVTITKILANEDGETEETCDVSTVTSDLAKALFPRKFRPGV